MLQLQVIGNIGGDAELHRENGNEFVTFKVAHNDRWTDANGVQRETTTWVSCVWAGNGGNLLQYLRKGQNVYAVGDAEVRQYHSQAQRQLVAGLNLRVRFLQLVGSRPDAVPSVLFDKEGIEVRVEKRYIASEKKGAELYDRTGIRYTTDETGVITMAPLPKDEVGNPINETI